MWKTFIVVLALTLLAGFLVETHAHFEVERFFGSHALYGFLACAALILVARAIGLILKRPDSYYDD
jgi:ABC-type transport system involved in cytochrome c biogenesis permease subunit